MVYKRFMVLPHSKDADIYAYYCVLLFPAEQQDVHYGVMQKDKWKSQQITFCYLKNYAMYRKQPTVK